MVGIVLVILPNFNEYKIVVFPAASSPNINILQFCLVILALLNSFLKIFPILLWPFNNFINQNNEFKKYHSKIFLF